MIHPYGLLVGLGILVGFWVASRFARKFEIRNSKFELSPNDVWGSLWWVVVPGIVGARIYHVVDLWEYYREHLALIPALWTGGLGIFGAIAGGIFGLWMFCWWLCRRERGHTFRLFPKVWLEKLSSLLSLAGFQPGRSSLHEKTSALFSECVRNRFLAFSDLAAFGLPIGQAIGRWGNFFNRELYGKPTDLPWGLFIPPEFRMAGFEDFTHFHPLFLYESLYSLGVFGVLFLIWRKRFRLHAGSYFFVYLILYGAGRFGLEVLRISQWAIFGINVAQGMGVLSIVLGGLLLYSLNRKRSYERN